MRRRLVLVFLAVSLMVTMAFVVPLGFLVRRTAEDRAIDEARADAAAVVPAMVSDGSRAQIEFAVEGTSAGRDGRMTVITNQGWTIGPEVEESQRSRVDVALSTGASQIGDVAGGAEVVAAVATGPEELAVVRVFVPESRLRAGQWRAWASLAGVAAGLAAISVVVADQLARSVVRPAQDLASAARQLGEGDLSVTVDPAGPAELAELGGAFNDLAGRVSSMLDHEREFVAELSHRLRTPLTKLRLRVDQVPDSDLASALRADVDDVTAAVNTLIREARGHLADQPFSDVAEVVMDRAEFWRVLAEDQNRSWNFDLDGTGAVVPVSRSELAAALDVLLENVFAHTAEGVPLRVGYRTSRDLAEVSVEDGGPGIAGPADEQGTPTAESTGLGLDIVRRTADDAGGSLEVGSSSLGGTRVVMALPIVAGAKPTSTPTSSR